jgi:hypothetical protein
MKKLFRIQFFGSQSDNRKSKIENREAIPQKVLAGADKVIR